ncbi:GatB/YqeY domain-containing protein [bacterium]|nr:GatB/YqeY domain-containing protein [bacterium]
MALAEQITEDMKTAMKAKDAERLGALRMIRAEILKREKEEAGKKLTDAEVQAVLQTLAKQRKDSIEQYTAGGRQDLADKEARELEVIQSYLPEELSDSEIVAAIDAVIAETGASAPNEMGKVMGPVMARLKQTGKPFDGKKVNGLVKDRLS